MQHAAVAVDLPCVNCGYNLRGLGIITVCPECGVQVRQSLLFVVDPSRSHLKPLSEPSRLGRALVLITISLFFAVMVLWAPYIVALSDEVRNLGGGVLREWPRWSPVLAGGLALMAFALVPPLKKPTDEEPSAEYAKGYRMFRLGLISWALLLAFLGAVDEMWPQWWMKPMFQGAPESGGAYRHVLRIALDVSAIMIVTGVRPVVRFLALRSLNHRVGQISRQGFLALTVALIVLWIADIARLGVALAFDSGTAWASLQAIAITADVVTLIGFAMITLAVANGFLDAMRLSRGMRRRTYQLEELLEDPPANGH